jgi:three-Cys-motif partner protein
MNSALLPEPYDDGLYSGDGVGSWSEDKYKLVGLYDQLFSKGMKNKWNSRVYIDLYSGPGLVKVRDRTKYLWGSPMIALGLEHPFDRYIFCEENPAAMSALERRVKAHFPAADVEFVPGNCNEEIDHICKLIPKGSRTNRVLTFCFVDPYDLSIKFSTVRRIADYLVDFLFLLALGMDANRNQAYYLNRKNTKIDDFLGGVDWRLRWKHLQNPKNFPRFLAEVYAEQMQSLNYLPVKFEQMKQVRSDIRNLPLYHLALFSRHQLAYNYWREVLKYSTPQFPLNFVD